MPPEPLTNFSPGQRVVVHTMPASPNIKLRLRELGMYEGSEHDITLKGGNMMSIQILNTNVALNKFVTDQILVDQYKALSNQKNNI